MFNSPIIFTPELDVGDLHTSGTIPLEGIHPIAFPINAVATVLALLHRQASC
jgi:hypothetical protein